MVEVNRENVRQVMKHLRQGKALWLHGKRISKTDNSEEFCIEYTYNGQNHHCLRKAAYVRSFLKRDYVKEKLYVH